MANGSTPAQGQEHPEWRAVNDQRSQQNERPHSAENDPWATDPTPSWFGDEQREKSGDTLRFGLLNADAIPEPGWSSKRKDLISWWQRDQLDGAMLTETSRYWPAVSEEDQWAHSTHGAIHDGMHSNLSCNRNEHRGRSEGSHQPGGTGVFTLGRLSHAVDSSGQDVMGLGRWSWTRLRGKGQKHLRLVSAYRPNPPSSIGDNAVILCGNNIEPGF